jgi:putative oxidoreductase
VRLTDLKLLELPHHSTRIDVAGWAMRISAGVLFVSVGLGKFETDSHWVRLFADAGFSDWFRFLTGVLQVLGGLLLFPPQTMRAGAVLAGVTMAGAVLVHMFLLDTGIGGAIIPAGLLAFVATIAFRHPD